MKQTDTIQSIEAKLDKEVSLYQQVETKEEKKTVMKRIKRYEKLLHDIDYKQINGKKYPVKKTPKDISKKELLALIDSVPTLEFNKSDALQQAEFMRASGF